MIWGGFPSLGLGLHVTFRIPDNDQHLSADSHEVRPRCSLTQYLISLIFQLKEGNMKADLEASQPAGQEDFAIRCRDVCRSYGKQKVLSNLNLTVPQGQMWVERNDPCLSSGPWLQTVFSTDKTFIYLYNSPSKVYFSSYLLCLSIFLQQGQVIRREFANEPCIEKPKKRTTSPLQ